MTENMRSEENTSFFSYCMNRNSGKLVFDGGIDRYFYDFDILSGVIADFSIKRFRR